MREALEEAGVDPDFTPVDRLPTHGAWAIAEHFADLNEEPYES